MNNLQSHDPLKQRLEGKELHWLVTGAAGFIGSHLVEGLLNLNQRVTGLDNFSTGKRANLEHVKGRVRAEQWARFVFIERDICNPADCLKACRDVNVALHQAALGSVPRSLEDPCGTHTSNVTGFINMLDAARRTGVSRFVYASSSAVYGDEPNLPKIESRIGSPLSPYAATKAMDEVYAAVFAQCYGMQTIGLRYFNVFGERQDPEGAYAAVVPKWIAAMIHGEPVRINGDGETSRDFCYVRNVVQANLLAGLVESPEAISQAYNIAVGERTTLNELFEMIRSRLASRFEHLKSIRPVYAEFRPGDVRHSQADITKAHKLLGYEPTHTIERGLDEALDWYLSVAAK